MTGNGAPAPVNGMAGTGHFRLGFLSHVDGHDPAREVYRDALERLVVADELGFDVAWIAQHHFGSGGGRMPSPLTFLAAVAARTHRIRLSTAVIILPLEEPLRVAEDLAVLNALSGRRVEVGVSTGYGENVYEAFGRPIEDRREVNTRAVGRLRAVLRGERLNTQADVLEPPEPELAERIWQGVFSEEGSRHAARARSHLLLNRAAYGYDEPTDVVQRPWADAFLQEWGDPRRGVTASGQRFRRRHLRPFVCWRPSRAPLELHVSIQPETVEGSAPASRALR
jgi:alkanesulfonate monooxygenase SsuD/methylene tetrahydromethanopterin reductase-like flavin-dependent oxidoreductase (luciferase family)